MTPKELAQEINDALESGRPVTLLTYNGIFGCDYFVQKDHPRNPPKIPGLTLIANANLNNFEQHLREVPDGSLVVANIGGHWQPTSALKNWTGNAELAVTYHTSQEPAVMRWAMDVPNLTALVQTNRYIEPVFEELVKLRGL